MKTKRDYTRIAECIVCSKSFKGVGRHLKLCKLCKLEHSERVKLAWTQKNKKRMKEKAKEYRQSHKKEAAEAQRKWRDENREWVNLRQNQYNWAKKKLL